MSSFCLAQSLMASRSATETAPEHMVSQDLLTHAVNASMIDYIDKKVVVTMRDDCQIVGRIRYVLITPLYISDRLLNCLTRHST